MQIKVYVVILTLFVSAVQASLSDYPWIKEPREEKSIFRKIHDLLTTDHPYSSVVLVWSYNNRTGNGRTNNGDSFRIDDSETSRTFEKIYMSQARSRNLILIFDEESDELTFFSTEKGLSQLTLEDQRLFTAEFHYREPFEFERYVCMRTDKGDDYLFYSKAEIACDVIYDVDDRQLKTKDTIMNSTYNQEVSSEFIKSSTCMCSEKFDGKTSVVPSSLAGDLYCCRKILSQLGNQTNLTQAEVRDFLVKLEHCEKEDTGLVPGLLKAVWF